MIAAEQRAASGADSRWPATLAEHRRAVHDCASRIALVPSDRWTRPRVPGKWSFAEEALHVAQVYEVLLAELAGGPGMRVRFPPWRVALFRHGVLPMLVALGRLPTNIRAPREVRPDLAEATLATPDMAADRVGQRAAAVEEALAGALERMRRDPRHRTYVTHPFFGQLEPVAALQFLSLHTKHHSRHLPRQHAAV